MERRSNYFNYMTRDEVLALANSRHQAKPLSTYLICATQRSGSTLLADGLRSAGVAGRPYEFFGVGEHNRAHWRNLLQISNDREYVQKIISAATTDNGVCGVKLLSDQLRAFRHFLNVEGLVAVSEGGALPDEISERLGAVRYIWVKRRNRVAQAISLFRATQSSEWVRPKGSSKKLAGEPIEFDFHRIDQFVRRCAARDKRWKLFFRTYHIQPLVVVYEEFAKTYEISLAAVLSFLGVASKGKIEPTRLEKQADQISLDWEARYRELKLAMEARSASANAQDVAPDTSSRAVENPPKLFITSITQARPAGEDGRTSHLGFRIIATRTGWLLLNPNEFEVRWNGGRLASDLKVLGLAQNHVSSRFGAGLLTFEVPFAFRTSPGFCLQVRGPANSPKDGVHPLEGIVESEVRDTVISINWKVTRPDLSITFKKNEPIGLLLPLRPRDMERFQLEYVGGGHGDR